MRNSYRKDELVFYEAELIDNREIAPGVFYTSLERCIDFVAGQVVALSMGKGQPHRLYSIASGKDEDYLGILFDVQPKGHLTPLLAKLGKGDTVYMSDAFGKFTDSKGKACWIATGTGIAPFISMLRSGIEGNKIIIQGGRDADSFYFSGEIEEIAGIDYTRCISQEKSAAFFNGRITEYLKKSEQLPLDCPYYLCGSAEMVVEVRDILIEKGVPYDQINAEIYF